MCNSILKFFCITLVLASEVSRQESKINLTNESIESVSKHEQFGNNTNSKFFLEYLIKMKDQENTTTSNIIFSEITSTTKVPEKEAENNFNITNNKLQVRQANDINYSLISDDHIDAIGLPTRIPVRKNDDDSTSTYDDDGHPTDQHTSIKNEKIPITEEDYRVYDGFTTVSVYPLDDGKTTAAIISTVETPLITRESRQNYDALNATELNSTEITTELTTVLTTTIETTPKSPNLDIPALLKIISDLVYYYDTNLTLWVNETLQHRKIPTCQTPSTTAKSLDYAINETRDSELVAKCFVCGLVERGIPYSAQCADGFSGDFIPLVPVNPTSKANLARFRKYCKYKNVWGVYYNRSDRKAIYGRWTGGCSVRWTDVTSVYTQRTCRNRNRAQLGRHYASKRMARLEMALRDKDNGCIISPMAVLTPLSRGISLYARYHACVCTGSWCNMAKSYGQVPWCLVLFLTTALGLLTV